MREIYYIVYDRNGEQLIWSSYADKNLAEQFLNLYSHIHDGEIKFHLESRTIN